MIAAAMQPPPLPGDKPGRHTTRRAPTAGQPKRTRRPGLAGRTAAAAGVCASFTAAARELGVGESTLGSWVAAARDSDVGGVLSREEREEVRRLKAGLKRRTVSWLCAWSY